MFITLIAAPSSTSTNPTPAFYDNMPLVLSISLPLTNLISIIISSLLASLITYLCLTRGRKQTHFSNTPVQKPSSTAPVPEYEPVIDPSEDLEMRSNEAYGHVTTTFHHVT